MRRERFTADTRGVQWTIEAFLAVLLLLSAIVIVAEVVPTGTQQAETEQTQEQLQQAGDDVLTLAESEGTLTEALLYWDTTDGTFIDTDTARGGQAHYTTFENAPEHPLAPLLSGTLDREHIIYNIHLVYDVAGTTERRPLVYQGPPGGDSVRASTTVVLSGDDEPESTDSCATLATLADCSSETFYTPETVHTPEPYAIVQVELELWRT